MKGLIINRIALVVLAVVLILNSQVLAAGKLIAWGFDNNGQCNAPEGSDYIAVAAGSYHSVALKADGSILCWGSDALGQCDSPAGKGYKAISANGNWTMALSADGSITAWGNDDYQQCLCPEGNGFVKIAAGVRHGLALREDGTIVAWGNNSYSQCDVPDGSFVDIAAGMYSSYAIDDAGKIHSWGMNAYGLLTLPDTNNVKAVATGLYHNVAVNQDGSLIKWGSNAYGQFNLSDDNVYKQASAGVFHTMAITEDGQLKCAGMDFNGQCNIPEGDFQYVNIACGDFHNVAIVKDPVITVDLKITPKYLSWFRKHGFIYCKIKASENYDITSIKRNSLRLNGEFKPKKVFINGRKTKLCAIFRVKKLYNSLNEGVNELTLTGVFKDGTKLEGLDSIKVKKQRPVSSCNKRWRRSWKRVRGFLRQLFKHHSRNSVLSFYSSFSRWLR